MTRAPTTTLRRGYRAVNVFIETRLPFGFASPGPAGDLIACDFPSGTCELTVCHDEELGTYLAAVLFRTVVDFPDQETARAIAEEALANIVAEQPERGDISRRDLFKGLQAS